MKYSIAAGKSGIQVHYLEVTKEGLPLVCQVNTSNWEINEP